MCVCMCVLWLNWKLGKPRHWWYNCWTWHCIELSSVDISASFSFLISIRPTCTFRIWYWCHYSAPKTYQHRPRCSAVAERPHHASCLSVIIFNSTIPWALSFIISYFGFRLPMRTIKFWSVDCCLRRNIKAFCHKQDSLMRGAVAFVDRGRRTTHAFYNIYSTVEMLTVQQWSMPKPDIGQKSRFLPQLGGGVLVGLLSQRFTWKN